MFEMNSIFQNRRDFMENLTSTAPDVTTVYITSADQDATGFSFKSKTLQDLSDLQSTSASQNPTSVYQQTTIPVDVALCSVHEFLTCWLIPVSSILSLISIFGNVATITNILRRRMYKNGTYLCILLVAMGDLLATIIVYVFMFILFPMMFELYLNIPLCVLFFWVGYTYHFWAGSNIVLLAFERYSLITNPFRYQTFHRKHRAVKISLLNLFILSVLCIAYAVVLSFIESCPEFFLIMYYFAFIGVPFFFIITGMLLFLHCYKLIKIKNMPNLSLQTSNKKGFSEMTTKIYLICLSFVFSRIPFVINDFMVLFIQFGLLGPSEMWTHLLYQIGTVFILANYAINPFIYFLSFKRMKSLCKVKRREIPSSAMSVYNVSKQNTCTVN